MAAANVKSAYMQTYAGVSSPPSDMPHTHLSGEREMSESLGGVRFRISPNDFFQVNTAAAEKLGEVLAGLVASVGSDLPLLDMCCGAGACNFTLPPPYSNIPSKRLLRHFSRLLKSRRA